MSKVYLAGGMRSGWQETVMAACPGVEWLDPRTHGLRDPKEYTAWDLQAVRDADVVFAYLEKSNPYGFNLAFEVGYAHALGKPIIFVDEKHAGTERPCSMIREVSDWSEDLAGGITLLGGA
jgi:nucleoside 2-deoxyribosyltransferase